MGYVGAIGLVWFFVMGPMGSIARAAVPTAPLVCGALPGLTAIFSTSASWLVPTTMS